MAKTKKELASNFGGFVISRGLGTIVDTGVLWFCEKFLFTGYWGSYLISPTISFEVATFFNFVLSYYWIWKNRIETKNSKIFWHLFLLFNISCIAGFLIKMLFLFLFERLFHFDAVICNLLALCISGIVNFFLSEDLVFRQKHPEPVHSLITVNEMVEKSDVLKSGWGKLFARWIMNVCDITKLNYLYDSVANYSGAECAAKAIDKMKCNYLIGNSERLDTLPEGAFITISNHPYGGLDGLILAELIGKKRPDYKIVVNHVLARAKAMNNIWITVTPTTTEKKIPDAITIKGIKALITQITKGHPIGCFPSGAVSDYKILKHSIQDRDWQPGMLKLIKRAKVPIVPIFFPDGNSKFYYFLGLISWKIRLMRLPWEFFNKKRGKHRVIIGDTLSVDLQNTHNDIYNYGQLLRSSVYNMPIPEQYIERKNYD